MQSSSPLSSTKLQVDSGPASEYDSEPQMSSCSTMPNLQQKDTFSLFLSNIHSYANISDVECMVRKSIGIEDEEEIKVSKLVPSWKDVSQLEYVSFKIVLNVRWKKTALSLSTWPTGIKFREFVCLSRTIWSPNVIL